MLRFELADATPPAPPHEHPTPGPVYYKDIGEEEVEAPSLAPLSVDVNSVFPDISEETFPNAVRQTVSQFVEPVGDDGESIRAHISMQTSNKIHTKCFLPNNYF